MLKHFFNLRKQVIEFLEEKGALPLETELLKNTSWLSDLAFLVDVTDYLNILNLKLQGKDCTLPTMFTMISGFKAKLNLFLMNLATENIDLFPTLKDLKENLNIVTMNCSKYEFKIRCLLQSFESRFQDFESKKPNIQIFMNPFTISLSEIISYPANIQLELTELQNHFALKNLFAEKISSKPQNSSDDFSDFWKLVPKEDFPAITDLALQFLSSFGSTYACEKEPSVARQRFLNLLFGPTVKKVEQPWYRTSSGVKMEVGKTHSTPARSQVDKKSVRMKGASGQKKERETLQQMGGRNKT
ncbi:unnamed protein product [Colias eurytheme]|nr:unnamed protein product [Colias eurytheme]